MTPGTAAATVVSRDARAPGDVAGEYGAVQARVYENRRQGRCTICRSLQKIIIKQAGRDFAPWGGILRSSDNR